MPNRISVFDLDGLLLWEGTADPAFVGLQPGQTFWLGPIKRTKRVWVHVVSVTYGLDTLTGAVDIEMTVQRTGLKRATKAAQKQFKVIDHGELELYGENGG